MLPRRVTRRPVTGWRLCPTSSTQTADGCGVGQLLCFSSLTLLSPTLPTTAGPLYHQRQSACRRLFAEYSRNVLRIWRDRDQPLLSFTAALKIRGKLFGGGRVAIRYDTTCNFNVQSKAYTSQLNLTHGTNNREEEKQEKKLKSKKRICPEVSVNSPGNPWSQSWGRKGRLRWEAFVDEEGLSLEWKSDGVTEY